MNKYISGTFYSMTDIGLKRTTNEDFSLTAINPFGEILLMVADGMGGRNKGDYASKFLCEEIETAFKQLSKKLKSSVQIEKWLYKTINAANKKIYCKSQTNEEFKGMGTTLSLAYLSNGQLVTAQVGDSRIYQINAEKKLEQITVDQTYVQYLQHSHDITDEMAKSHPERHKITNAIGIRKECNVDFKTIEYFGQTLLLCSDGVYNNVSNTEISSILKSSDIPERKCIQLISFGNINGGSDNMAVIVWEDNK